ncbi:ABC transporter substrate-binding protein [Clostridium beijerinckii]|uniref:ABC transporter substrate-binding protein n=1 Tax=Clostridium beijerinckii TaxID=1520 RepID=A0A0B5QLQ9_CLOBE|nr:ABC transporter substrate-binding protein [Clostridium beijerinckii]AJG98967.1 ABC transporter substrate-binding protein [Clostridium beijerinckii]AQS04808.1 putative ABC transporter extracellular-binding protein YckB precursor [Clostridium beijerinckii]MBA2887515.1 polar amino acid transport system substrate-binding protein [Clostridium beijerinckii]MBA2902405.1 polar amino acid transport system substrate-binding protein [Clostridium beijerinckii]MBA2912305.1 polar amino acid transport sys
MKIHKKLLVFAMLLINIIQLIFCGANIPNNEMTKDRLERVKEKGLLVIASSNDIPFAYIDPKTKEFTGIDAEIIREAAKRLGINKVEMKQIPFNNLLKQLNTDDSIDIVADGMYVTDERKKEALFTNILYKESEAIITPKVSKIVFKEDFKNAVIGAQVGTAFLDLANKWKAEGVVKDVVSFKNQNDLLSAVSTKKIDAAITDSIFASYMIFRSNLYLRVLPPTDYTPESPGKIAAAVRKNDITLAKAINEKIDEMKYDKTIPEILEKYGLNSSYFVSVTDGHIYLN